MEDLSAFIENINHKMRLSAENMERLTAAFQVVKVKRKQLLIQPGFVAKYRIYVLKGAFHSYAIDDKGNEHTI
jgi:CRP-like cAMP-binding protein